MEPNADICGFTSESTLWVGSDGGTAAIFVSVAADVVWVAALSTFSEEFRIHVQPDLWPGVFLLHLVPNGDPAFAGLNPPPPGLPATCVGSYYNPLREPSLTWF